MLRSWTLLIELSAAEQSSRMVWVLYIAPSQARPRAYRHALSDFHNRYGCDLARVSRSGPRAHERRAMHDARSRIRPTQRGRSRSNARRACGNSVAIWKRRRSPPTSAETRGKGGLDTPGATLSWSAVSRRYIAQAPILSGNVQLQLAGGCPPAWSQRMQGRVPARHRGHASANVCCVGSPVPAVTAHATVALTLTITRTTSARRSTKGMAGARHAAVSAHRRAGCSDALSLSHFSNAIGEMSACQHVLIAPNTRALAAERLLATGTWSAELPQLRIARKRREGRFSEEYRAPLLLVPSTK
jgi:hypothetical protein